MKSTLHRFVAHLFTDDWAAGKPFDMERWIELLLTDSLGRPLAGAYCTVQSSDGNGGYGTATQQRLDDSGKIELPWSPGGLRLCVGYRALLLAQSPPEPRLRLRDTLTCLGYDLGGPGSALDETRTLAALEAFAKDARRYAGCKAADPEQILATWVAGDVGVGENSRSVVGSLALRARRRLRRLRGRATDQRATSSYLAGDAVMPNPRRSVKLGVAVGARGSSGCRNRLVVYDWFTGLGPPPCEGNAIEELIDGEQAWERVSQDLETANEEFCVTTWWLDPDIELRRPKAIAASPPSVRQKHTLASHVERLAKRGATSRFLVWSWLDTPLVHPRLRGWSTRPHDQVEVLQRGHPKLLGSFHKKLMVIDRKVAYCGGFNMRQNDWDSQHHAIQDCRRNPHAADREERSLQAPSFPPRHDVSSRIRGPLVAHVHDVFSAYWNATLPSRQRSNNALGEFWARLRGSGPASRMLPMRRKRDVQAGNILAQLVLTEPHRARRQQPIYDVLLRAIHNARRLIYIENQYFRSDQIAEALVRALQRNPRLNLLVVTNHVTGPLTFAYGGAFFTAQAQRVIREARPQFKLHQLLARGRRAGRCVYLPVEVHAKVMVVDDHWCTIGSANLNERSIRSEAEANVAIEDAALSKRLRCRLMAEHLGLQPDDPSLQEPQSAYATFVRLAEQNAVVRAQGGLAQGHAHPFEQASSIALFRGRAEWF
jgi:phosphatidylserine/phosphatidylglycerophosphate/cardiolipin synthase-like enzyme